MELVCTINKVLSVTLIQCIYHIYWRHFYWFYWLWLLQKLQCVTMTDKYLSVCSLGSYIAQGKILIFMPIELFFMRKKRSVVTKKTICTFSTLFNFCMSPSKPNCIWLMIIINFNCDFDMIGRWYFFKKMCAAFYVLHKFLSMISDSSAAFWNKFK